MKQPFLYDPGVEEFEKKPPKDSIFDGVLCIDVLEHVHPKVVDDTICELIAHADKFLFLAITTVPARKKLVGGINMHTSVYPEAWWRSTIARLNFKPDLKIEIVFDNEKRTPKHATQDNNRTDRPDHGNQ